MTADTVSCSLQATQEEIDSAVLVLLSYLAHLGEAQLSASSRVGPPAHTLEDEPHAAITSEAEIFTLMYKATQIQPRYRSPIVGK